MWDCVMFYGKYPNLSGKRYGRMNKYAHLVTTYDAKLKLTLNLPVILYLKWCFIQSFNFPFKRCLKRKKTFLFAWHSSHVVREWNVITKRLKWMLQKVLKNYSFETIHLTLELQNHIGIDILYFDHIGNYKCGRHSSVDLSMPTILRPWVLIPSTTSMLYSIRKVNCDVKRTNVNRKRGLDRSIFFFKKI